MEAQSAYVAPPKKLLIHGDASMFLQLADPEDTEVLYRLIHANREHLQMYQPWAKDITLEGVRQSLEVQAKQINAGERLQYRVMLPRQDSKHVMIGTITLFEHDAYNRTAKLGYWLAKDAQGYGYAIRAAQRLALYGFEDWHLQRIILRIQPGNEHGERLATRLGAHPTAVIDHDQVDDEKVPQRVWVLERPV